MCPFLGTPEGFTPETLELLDRTFAAAWHDLQMRKSSSGSPADQKTAQTAITEAIKELAATGVREPARLKRHALHAAAQASPRKPKTVQLTD